MSEVHGRWSVEASSHKRARERERIGSENCASLKLREELGSGEKFPLAQ